MENKKPWLVPGVPWKTEGAFISWIRGVLRKGWKNHPVKIEYLNSRKMRITNTNPKSKKTHPTVWGYVCEECHQEHKADNIEVDHAGAIQGRFTCFEEIQGYAEHLFLVDFDSLEVVCKPCHQVRTYAQKNNLTFNDAAIEKEIIAICKKSVKEILAFCQDYGYDSPMLSNAEKRKVAVTNILKGIE